jgi:hypothetical protein
VRCLSRLALLSLLAIAGVGCSQGDGRSTAAYCKAYWDGAVPFHDRVQGAVDRKAMFETLANLLSASGDMAVIFDHMAQAAPVDIRPDTEAVRDSLKKAQDAQGDAVMNPLKAILSGAVTGLSSAGSWDRVETYLNNNCPAPAAVQAAMAATTTTTPLQVLATQSVSCDDGDSVPMNGVPSRNVVLEVVPDSGFTGADMTVTGADGTVLAHAFVPGMGGVKVNFRQPADGQSTIAFKRDGTAFSCSAQMTLYG